MNADELIELARELAGREAGRPRQTSLKRAASTAYYALFHALAAECVGQTIGWTFRSARYWEVVTPLYRVIDHNGAKRVFNRLLNETVSPAELKLVGRALIDLQEARIQADYDPAPIFTRRDVIDLIESAENAIRTLRALSADVKRELVVQILAKQR